MMLGGRTMDSFVPISSRLGSWLVQLIFVPVAVVSLLAWAPPVHASGVAVLSATGPAAALQSTPPPRFDVGPLQEEQVHLTAVGNCSSQIVVEFVSPISAVGYVQSGPAASSPSSWSLFPTASEFFPSIGHLHRVLIHGLQPHVPHSYRIGFPQEGWGQVYTFTPLAPESRGQSPVFAMFGDFGLSNDVSMALLHQQAAAGEFDAVIHVGDIAYDLFANDSQVGNDFMNAVQPMSAKMPYMVCPGNHEHADNFTQYSKRFQGHALGPGAASGTHTPMYYSWDAGLIHFVSLDTEVYLFFNETSASPYPFLPQQQLDWLKNDLEKANANRQAVPWIVVYRHKPWFVDFQWHKKKPNVMVANQTGFQSLFFEYGVDAVIGGHVHIYQRFYPLRGPAKLKPLQPPGAMNKSCVEDHGSYSVYRNPNLPAHLVAGSPGDQEVTSVGMCVGEDLISPQIIGTYGKCLDAYGYGLLQAVNATHLHWKWQQTGKGNIPLEQVSQEGPIPVEVGDELWIIQEGRQVHARDQAKLPLSETNGSSTTAQNPAAVE